MSTPTLDGKWFCPTCEDAHDGPCPAVTPPGLSVESVARRLLHRMVGAVTP